MPLVDRFTPCFNGMMLHLRGRNEPHERLLGGDGVKKKLNVCCSQLHPAPTAAVLSVSRHNWAVSGGEKTSENPKCCSFSLRISRDNWTVLRDLRVEHVARNEYYLVMEGDRSLACRGCQTSVK